MNTLGWLEICFVNELPGEWHMSAAQGQLPPPDLNLAKAQTLVMVLALPLSRAETLSSDSNNLFCQMEE